MRSASAKHRVHVVLDEDDRLPALERARAARSCAATLRCPCRPSARRAAAGAGRVASAMATSSWRCSPCARFAASTSIRASSPPARKTLRAGSVSAGSLRASRQKRKLWPACACTASATFCSALNSRIDAGDLERAGQAPARAPGRRQRSDVLAGEADLARVGKQVAGELADEGGLAGAVRADHRVGLALDARPGDAVARAQRAEGLPQFGDGEQRLSHGFSSKTPAKPRLKNSTDEHQQRPEVRPASARSSATASPRAAAARRRRARGPRSVPMPPRITMTMISPERVQCM